MYRLEKKKYKSVFVTGGTNGIGRALVELYAVESEMIGVISTDRSENMSIISEFCRELDCKFIGYKGDVTNKKFVKESIESFLMDCERIDILIANAGVAEIEKENYGDDDAVEKNIAVNYYGVVNTVLAFLPTLKAQNEGAIAVISSISSLRSTQNSGAYSASKAAVNRWIEGLRLRVHETGISVTTICVGFVDTEMTRGNNFWMPGIISAENAAKKINNCIKRRKRLSIFPIVSGGIWYVFGHLPEIVYDNLINYLKTKKCTIKF